MKPTNFNKLFDKIVFESKKFNKKYSIIKEDEDTEAAPEDVIQQDDDQEEEQGDFKVLDDDDIQGNEDNQDDEDYQDENDYDFSDLDGVTEDQANEIVEQLKADDDIINNTLIMMEQIFWKVAGVNDEEQIPSNPKFQEFVDEMRSYISSEWGMDWDEIQDEQEMLFYTLAFLVNEKKDLFDSEEEWKKFYVLFEAENQESQSIIYPTWMQGRGILDFFLQYFDDEYQDEDEQVYEDQDQEENDQNQNNQNEE